MPTTPFTGFKIYPAYASGFEFVWEVSPGFSAPAPWVFTVYQGPAPDGPWEPISPAVSGVRRWHDGIKRIVPKADTLWFMCRMKAGTKTYDSTATLPYATLDKRAFLIGRDIMRQEVLHARTLAGVECTAYVVATGGPTCPKCLDPITGQVRDPACPVCVGTGRMDAFLGPYKAWMLVTPKKRQYGHAEVGGTEEPVQLAFRLIGTLPLKKNDVISDPGTGKMYIVDGAENVAEIQRVPLVQSVTASEAPVSDPIYALEPNR